MTLRHHGPASTGAVLAVVLSMLASTHTSGQEVDIEVLNPARNGVEVGRGMTVEGIGSVPSGHHVWVLTRRTDFDEVWWPQGEARFEGGRWAAAIQFGNGIDVGWRFDIAVAVVAEPEHLRLKAYRQRAMTTNEWRPIPMPSTSSAPVRRWVTKVSH